MKKPQTALEARKRRAMQQEIVDTARGLFSVHGYDETTVDKIAEAIGMSQRSVFRYFRNKEEIVLGKFDLVAEEMLNALRERPVQEPVWESLRRMFDRLVVVANAPNGPGVAKSIHRIVFETPMLFAGYLQRLQQMQEPAVAILIERAAALGAPYGPNDPAPRAFVAAAVGCLVAAQHSWLANGETGSYADNIDRAMETIRSIGENEAVDR